MTDYRALIDEAQAGWGDEMYGRLLAAVEALVAERDALRTRLDSMTEQPGYRPPTRNLVIPIVGFTGKSFRPTHHRLVGPWVEVPESEGEA